MRRFCAEGLGTGVMAPGAGREGRDLLGWSSIAATPITTSNAKWAFHQLGRMLFIATN